jgi:hypothetical protein
MEKILKGDKITKTYGRCGVVRHFLSFFDGDYVHI